MLFGRKCQISNILLVKKNFLTSILAKYLESLYKLPRVQVFETDKERSTFTHMLYHLKFYTTKSHRNEHDVTLVILSYKIFLSTSLIRPMSLHNSSN